MYLGLSHIKATGRYAAFFNAKAMTPSAPHRVATMQLRASMSFDKPEEAASSRDASIMFLTAGRCRHKKLFGLPCPDWEVAKRTKAVQDFRKEVIDYNAAENVFLVREGYLQRVGRKPGATRVLASDERILFGVAESELTERFDVPIGLEEWAESVPMRKRNILLSAPAGYGKTHIIQHVLKRVLEERYGKKGLWVIASTGLAALALGGVTIHSAAGLKRGNKKIVQDLVDEMKATVKARWRLVKAIIIEKFSMLSADFLDLLDGVARIMKKEKGPFGGVYILTVGDLAQLAPVPDFQANVDAVGPKWKKVAADYAFESQVWAHANFQCFQSPFKALLEV